MGQMTDGEINVLVFLLVNGHRPVLWRASATLLD